MYKSLNPDKIIETIKTLHQRIEERFPDTGLVRVCSEFYSVANTTRNTASKIAKPNYLLRVSVGIIILFIVIGAVYSISLMDITMSSMDIGEVVQISESAMNDVVLIGAALFFLVTVEIRIKRRRVLDALHELRTLAHVIDMHQLTKDPSRYQKNVVRTKSSPTTDMTAYELMRYLDYCSEMLSLTGKVAALYAEDFTDAVVLSAVNELESLTTGLSRKIWQKIMILHKLDETNTIDLPAQRQVTEMGENE